MTTVTTTCSPPFDGSRGAYVARQSRREQGRGREKERGGEGEQGRQTNATCVEYHLRKMLNTLSENEMERQRRRGGEEVGKTSVRWGEGGR